MSQSLFIIPTRLECCLIYCSHCLCFTFKTVLVCWIKLESLIIDIKCLMILLHQMMNLGLPWVRFHKIRINRQALISIFHSRWAIHQFNVSRAPIWIYFNICGITSQTFWIFLDSTWEITLCEQSVSSFPVLFTLYGIQILLILIVLLHLLHLLQSILDILIIKLEQGTFI